MLRRYQWRIALPPEQVLARLQEKLIGEDALRARMTDRLEDQLAEWRDAGRPMGRVRGCRYRIFLPREVLRNPVAPVMKGRVEAEGDGSRLTMRVGLGTRTLAALSVVFVVYGCYVVLWILFQMRSGPVEWQRLALGAVFNEFVLVFAIIFGIFRFAARGDVRTCRLFVETVFKDELARDGMDGAEGG